MRITVELNDRTEVFEATESMVLFVQTDAGVAFRRHGDIADICFFKEMLEHFVFVEIDKRLYGKESCTCSNGTP